MVGVEKRTLFNGLQIIYASQKQRAKYTGGLEGLLCLVSSSLIHNLLLIWACSSAQVRVKFYRNIVLPVDFNN